MTRGTHHVLNDVREDLRSYDRLLDLLPGGDPDAIYDGWPAESRGFPVAVVLTVISDVSTPHRGVMERTYRIQATVVSERSWREWYDNREDPPSSIGQMGRILHRVAERMDRAKSVQSEIPLGSEGGTTPLEMDGGRVAMTEDWLVTGFYDETGID